MNRRDCLKTLSATTAALAIDPFFNTSALAQAKPASSSPPPNKMTTLRLASDITLIQGLGGNIAIFNGADGKLTIDSGVPDAVGELLAAESKVSAAPVATLINTHFHVDHVGGNERLGLAGARIIAHDNVRKRLSEKTNVEWLKKTFDPLPKPALPVITLSDTARLYFNEEQLQLVHFPNAHTDGDIVVHFENHNILHAGDLVWNSIYPFIDYSTGGWIGGKVAANDGILKMVDERTKVIPGHGAMTNMAGVREFRDMLATVQERITRMMQQGKPLPEIIASKPTAEFDAKYSNNKPGDKFTELVYLGIERQQKSA